MPSFECMLQPLCWLSLAPAKGIGEKSSYAESQSRELVPGLSQTLTVGNTSLNIGTGIDNKERFPLLLEPL